MSNFKIGEFVFINNGPYCGYFGEITGSELKNGFTVYKISILDEDGYQLSTEKITEDCLELAEESVKDSLQDSINYLKLNAVEI
jgi:hypothetical protein